jgi:hypothetical protein
VRAFKFFCLGYLLVVGVAWVMEASAQECGSMQCEAAKAADPTCTGAFPNRLCEGCRKGPGDAACSSAPNDFPANKWAYAACQISYPNQPPGTMNVSVRGVSNPCNCAARPDLPTGSRWGSGGYTCAAGCEFTPRGPSVSYPDLSGDVPGASIVTDGGAGWRPTGAECNPLEQEPAGDEPTPDPNCDSEQCISAPDPPDFCIEHEGKTVCAPSDQGPCAGNPSDGYLCVGSPPEEPPPPPATKPDPEDPSQPAPPDSEGGPVTNCNGSGSCVQNNWHYHEGGGSGGDPPDDPDPPDSDDPPTEPGGMPGACPDGSTPQNGQCPVEVTCPGGTTPVNGQCPGSTSCPTGETVLPGGQCSGGGPGVTTCPNGATPNPNGTCPGVPSGTCPNGSAPVNGFCDIASPCDPQTDPNQCQGPPDGQASGGQTCGAAPACAGDPILCMNVYQTWRTRCAIENVGSDMGEPTEADHGELVDPSIAWGDGDGTGGTGIDSGGWIGGGGGDCPDLGTVAFMGEAFAISDWVPCSVLRILATMILVGGLAQGAYIIGRG